MNPLLIPWERAIRQLHEQYRFGYDVISMDVWNAIQQGEITAFDKKGAPLGASNISPTILGTVHINTIKLEEWLKDKGYTFTKPRQPEQRQAQQESAILNEIQHIGHNPLQMPKNNGGRKGIKSLVRDNLAKSDLFEASTAFDKAWERLRRAKKIVDRS